MIVPRHGESRWKRRLEMAVRLHDIAVSGYRLFGGEAAFERIEKARLGVVDEIDAALAAGTSEPAIDAELQRLRREEGVGCC